MLVNSTVSVSRFELGLPSWNHSRIFADGEMRTLLSICPAVLSGGLFASLSFHTECWTPCYSCIRHFSGSIVLKLDSGLALFFHVSNSIFLKLRLFWELVFGFGWSFEYNPHQHVSVATFESSGNGVETYFADELPWGSYQSGIALFHSKCNLGRPSSSSFVHLAFCCLSNFESACD